MITESDYPACSLHGGMLTITGALVGAGSSAPAVVSTATVPAIDNYVSSISRTSEGLYVATFRQFPERVLNVHVSRFAASGAFKHAFPVSFSTADKTVTFQVMLADGSGVDDIESTDTVRITVIGRKELY